MTLNRYGATLIQDTVDFFYYARSAINQVLTEFNHVSVDSIAAPVTLPSFCSWLFAYQIERVFDLSCRGHGRRQHPYVRMVDRLHQLIDLDAITKATIRVPRIYGDQELDVWLWQDDLVIRYNTPPDRRVDFELYVKTNAFHSNI